MNAAVIAKNAGTLKREPAAAKNIPYSVHLTPTVIQTENRDYVTVLRLSGASFESADDEQLNNWSKRLNRLMISIASNNVALWQHIVRRPQNSYPDGEFEPGFAHDLNAKYAKRVSGETLMVNELYLTVVYRPQASFIGKAFVKLTSLGDRDALAREREESIEALGKIVAELESSLHRYEAEWLGVYRHKGILCSEPLEFFGYLVNAEWQRIALAQAPLSS